MRNIMRNDNSVYHIYVGKKGYSRDICRLPLIITTIAVSLLKVADITAVISLIKLIVGKNNEELNRGVK